MYVKKDICAKYNCIYILFLAELCCGTFKFNIEGVRGLDIRELKMKVNTALKTNKDFKINKKI